MNIGLCKSCGNAFDMDEINDGFCLDCAPDAGAIMSMEEPPKVDWNALGDCE